MSKKEISIIILIGVVIFSLTIIIMYLISNNKTHNNKSESKNDTKILTVGKYKVSYGKYKGVEEEYDPETENTNKKDVFLEISKTMIKSGDHNETYTIKNYKIVTSNGLEYEVIGNNKLELLVGGGIIYEYQE